MSLTPEQIIALRAAVLADQTALALYNVGDRAGLADYYNGPASPDFWVWRTSVGEHEITRDVSPDATTWSWTAFIGRSQGERDGYTRMFNTSLTVNPSLPNVRAGFQDIFSGASGAAQRAHLLAMFRRKTNRVERVFVSGTGSTANPGNLGYEGEVTPETFIDV